MSASGALVKLSPRDCDAVLFDLDGVLIKPFDEGADCREHVDGKPRLAGVAGFLRSRNIELPEGSASDAAAHGRSASLVLDDARDFLHERRCRA